MSAWILPAATVLLGVVVLAGAVLALRTRSHTRRALAHTRAEAASLRAQLEELERRLPTGAQTHVAPDEPDAPRYVITGLGDGPGGAVDGEDLAPARIDRALFADLVLRETVVRAAALSHGVRRALAPEVRHRIRFEMRREVRASRKRRLRERKDLLRQARAAQRAAVAEDAA